MTRALAIATLMLVSAVHLTAQTITIPPPAQSPKLRGLDGIRLSLTGNVITISWDSTGTGVGGGSLTSLNGLTAGTQTFAIDSASNTWKVVSSGSVHTLSYPGTRLAFLDKANTLTQTLTLLQNLTVNGLINVDTLRNPLTALVIADSATITGDGTVLGTMGATTYYVGSSGTIYNDNGTTFNIRNNTSDGADTKQLLLSSGGSVLQTRGAAITLNGNEYASVDSGSIRIQTGTVRTSSVFFRAGDVAANAMILDRSSGRPRLTLGTTAASSGGKLYFGDSLYHISTLVMDGSRNLVNIGSITASGTLRVDNIASYTTSRRVYIQDTLDVGTSNIVVFNNANYIKGTSSTAFDFNPNQEIRFFRETNNASAVFRLLKGDGTATTTFSIVPLTGATAINGASASTSNLAVKGTNAKANILTLERSASSTPVVTIDTSGSITASGTVAVGGGSLTTTHVSLRGSNTKRRIAEFYTSEGILAAYIDSNRVVAADTLRIGMTTGAASLRVGIGSTHGLALIPVVPGNSPRLELNPSGTVTSLVTLYGTDRIANLTNYAGVSLRAQDTSGGVLQIVSSGAVTNDATFAFNTFGTAQNGNVDLYLKDIYTGTTQISSGSKFMPGGLTTEGALGVAAVNDTVRWTGQGGTITAQNLANTATGKKYLVTIYANTTTTGTGTATVTISWNDGAGAKTHTTESFDLSSTGNTGKVGETVVMYVGSGTPTWSTSATVTGGSPQYAVNISAMREW